MTGAFTLAAAVLSSAGPPLPFVDRGACPFECCVYREWDTLRPVVIRRARSRRLPVAFRLREGEKVRALTGVVITSRPQVIRLKEPMALVDQDDETPRPSRARAGDRLYLLTSRGEGFFVAWFKGRLFRSLDAGFLFGSDCWRKAPSCPAVVEQESQSTWWIRLQNGKGQTGWTDEPDAFANKDACG